jgi:hypothetical protein
VVTRPNDTASEEKNGIKVNDARGGLAGYQIELIKKGGYHNGDKKFEEALYPKMDNPEPPVVDDIKIGATGEEHGGSRRGEWQWLHKGKGKRSLPAQDLFLQTRWHERLR